MPINALDLRAEVTKVVEEGFALRNTDSGQPSGCSPSITGLFTSSIEATLNLVESCFDQTGRYLIDHPQKFVVLSVLGGVEQMLQPREYAAIEQQINRLRQAVNRAKFLKDSCQGRRRNP